MKKPNLIHYNDGRHLHFYLYDPPPSLHRMRQPVDELVGTGVDMLSFGLATGQAFLHDTQVGDRFGERLKEHNSGLVWWRAATNLAEALKAGHDPLKIVVDRAHEKGIKVLGSLRINDGGSPDEEGYNIGRLKREHPDVIIGEEDPENPATANALDFARPEVREERLAVIEEVCDRYGADGIEIDDYIRVFFAPSQVRQNTPILTDFIREIRDMLDRVGKKRGDELYLAVRAHRSEEANLAVGMDLRTWLTEKLVNIVIPHPDGPAMETDLSLGWLPEAAHESGAWVYVKPIQLPYDDRYHKTTIEMYRAASLNYRAAGADGLYLSDLHYPRTEREYLVMREMSDPDTHARKSKHYFVAPKSSDSYYSPAKYEQPRYLPVTLVEGVTAKVPISVGDDLDSAISDGELERVTLGVRVEQTCPEDRLSFRFNGREFSEDDAKVSSYYAGLVSYAVVKQSGQQLPERILTHYWFEFDLPLDLPRRGENEVEVTLERHFRPLTAKRVLVTVEVWTVYKNQPVGNGGQMP